MAAAGATAAILATLGGLSLLSMRGIMQRDAEEIGTAGARAVAAAMSPATFDFPADDAAAALQQDRTRRAVEALKAALPNAITFELSRVSGDSMLIVADYVAPPDRDHVTGPSRAGQNVEVARVVLDAWAAGRPAIAMTQSRYA